MAGSRRVGVAALVTASLLVPAGLGAVPAGAAAARSPFCAAVRAFNADRPPTRPAAVASLTRLGDASPGPVRAALKRLARAVQRGDAAAVLATAAGGPGPASVAAAGQTVIGASRRACPVPVNLLVAVPTGISARPVSPAAWAQAVCSSLTSWGAALQNAGSNLLTPLSGVTTTLPEVRTSLTQFLDASVLRTQQLVDQLDAAGTPAARNGNQFAAYLHDGAVTAGQTFLQDEPVVEALPDDPQGFQTSAQQLVVNLDAAGRRVAALVRTGEATIRSPALRRAFAAAPACAGLT